MKNSYVPAPVRFFHWGIALLVVLNLYVFEHGKSFHEYAGYTCVALVISRVLFGHFFYEKRFSFRRFELRWSELKHFIQGLIKGKKKDFEGHNPIASYVYLCIWGLVCLLGISGFLMKEVDALWGNETLENTHEIFSLSLITFIILHLIGIVQDSLHFKRKTWKRMFTGKDS